MIFPIIYSKGFEIGFMAFVVISPIAVVLGKIFKKKQHIKETRKDVPY